MSSQQMTVNQSHMYTELLEHIDAMLQMGQMTAQQAAEVLRQVAAVLMPGKRKDDEK